MDALTSIATATFVAFLFVARIGYLTSQGLPFAVGRHFDVASTAALAAVAGLAAGSAGAAAYGVCRLAADCSAGLAMAPDIALAVQLLIVVAFGGVLEELLFRGFLLNGLAHRFGVRLANAIQAAAFGLAHLVVHQDLAVLLSLTVLGYVLGAVALRARTLWAAAAFHASWNVGAVLIAVPFESLSWRSRSDLSGFSPLVRVELTAVPAEVMSTTIGLLTSQQAAVASSLALMVLAHALSRRLLPLREACESARARPCA